MLSGRMLKILEYFQSHTNTTYKDIAKDLNISLRNVRYDIDKINIYFSNQGKDIIRKESKGVLILNQDIDLRQLLGEDVYIFSIDERKDLLLLMLLFDHEKLRLNKISKELQVSRSTIKNDFDDLQIDLLQYDIEIIYNDYYGLSQYNHHIVNMMNQLLSQYFYLYQENPKTFNHYQLFMKRIIDDSFKGILINDIILWAHMCCEKYHSQLNDDEYKWYVSQIIVFCWFIVHDMDLPKNMGFIAEDNNFVQYHQDIECLENILSMNIIGRFKGALIRLLEYLDNDQGLYEKVDIVYIQFLFFQLLEKMSSKLDIDFTQDKLLRESLLKHVIPLMKRLKLGFSIYYNAKNVILKSYLYVYDALLDVISHIDIFNHIDSEDEVAFLAVYFIASIRRLKVSLDKNVLIVCYHGYGTSALLRDVLSHEFKVKVVDVIPNYKLSTYGHMNHIDFIISTLPIKECEDIPVVTINPILTYEDYDKLNEVGIQRRSIPVNYLSLQKKLDFLDEVNKQKVLNVLKEELGYSQNPLPKKAYRVSDLLREDCIQVKDEHMIWKDAIMESSSLLVDKGFVKDGYGQKILKDIQEIGFYCVTDEYFALFHGKECHDVYMSGMSLIINRQYVFFDDKRVKVIFCLASKDKKDQIPAMILLMRMLKKTNFLEKIQLASSPHEVYRVLKDCEEEVIS